MDIRVECYSGNRAEETPRRLFVGSRCVEVDRVTERWQTPDGRGFRLLGEDGLEYVVRQDDASGHWTLARPGGR